MLNLHSDLTTIPSVAALAVHSGYTVNSGFPRSSSSTSAALQAPSPPVQTRRFFGNSVVLALKASQSKLSMLQSLSDKVLGIEDLLHQIKGAVEKGAVDASQVQAGRTGQFSRDATLNQVVAQLKGFIASGNSVSLSSQGVANSQESAWSSTLDHALVQMEDALENLGSTFADSVSPMSTLNANSSVDSTSSSNVDGLSAALQSVSEARSAIDASAGSLYQISLANAANHWGDAISSKLIENIDSASGSLNFNIEQTLLQAGNDVLRDRSTISALVTYLLQP